MAAIVRAEIPDAALSSQDALLAYALTLCDESYRSSSDVREVVNVTTPPIAVGEFRDLDRIDRLTGRVLLRLSPGYQASNLPIWENVIPIGLVDIPPGWKK